MTSKELTYQDIVKLRKQMQENNRNFYEQPIVITYQQAIQIENECLALEQENEKLKKALCVFSTHLQIERGLQEEWLQFKNGEDQSDYLTQQEYELLKEVLGNES